MDIEKYRLHYLILEQQNLSQTARTTNYTQSTLSARVQKMEQELGTSVFQRTTTGLQITEAGILYKNFLRQTCEQYELLQQQLLIQPTQITLGMSRSSIHLYGSVIAKALQQQGNSPNFIIKTSGIINGQVHRNELSYAIISEPVQFFDEVNYSVLADEFFDLTSRHPLTLSPNQPAFTLLVLSKTCVYTTKIVQWLESENIAYHLKEIDSVGTIKDLLQLPRMAAVLNTKLIEPQDQLTEHLIPIDRTTKTYCITNKQAPPLPLATLIKNKLSEYH